MITIKEAKTNGLVAPDGGVLYFPKEFSDVLPDTCVCGADLKISEALTRVCCPNPRCITKVTQRAYDMLAHLGVLGMGEAKCRQFFEIVKIYNPYVLFAWNMNDAKRFTGVFSVDFLQSIYDQLQSKRTFTLAEFVKAGFFPGVQDSAFKIFKTYDDITKFYADYDEQGIQLIANLLSVQPTAAKCIEVYTTLGIFRKDLELGVRFVNIRKSVRSVSVCISTAVGAPFKSKGDFVNYINSTYGDQIHLNWLNSVTRTGCDYLICASSDAGTHKATKARMYNVPILSGAEFEQRIKQGTV